MATTLFSHPSGVPILMHHAAISDLQWGTERGCGDWLAERSPLDGVFLLRTSGLRRLRGCPSPTQERCRRSGTVVTRTPSCRLGAHQRGGSRSPVMFTG